MAKEPISRRGKSAWVGRNMFGTPKVISGQTSGGSDRAAKASNSRSGGFGSGQGSRTKRTGSFTGGGF